VRPILVVVARIIHTACNLPTRCPNCARPGLTSGTARWPIPRRSPS